MFFFSHHDTYRMKIRLPLLALFFTAAASLCAQQATPPSAQPAAPDKALKMSLNEDGSHWFQVTFLNQTWVRWDQSNPGTTVLGKDAPSTFDIGLRRTRMQMYGQVTDRAFVYLQFGMNNFNFLTNNPGNRKQSAFFHDALCEYRVTKGDALKLGGGLTITNGLSRFSQPSVGTIMTLDVPVFAQATVDQTDEFSRKLSVYARGQIGKVDYRFSFSDPFPITSNGRIPPTLSTRSNFAQLGHTQQLQGYVAYQLFDKEPHTTPYMTGTYLGKKKVFNIGGGAIYQPDAMWHLTSTGDTAYTKMLLLAGEAFLDMPLNKEKGTALSAYAGYFNYDFGPDYLRYNGLMNPANGTSATDAVTGAGDTWGNAVPMMGTGSVVYAQVGYLLPKTLLGEGHGQLLPYASWTHSSFERLGKGNSVDVLDAGMNWLIDNHKAKISLGYSNRPTYTQDPADGTIGKGPRRSQAVLLFQIFI
jgi:hypothetical protein